MSETTRTIERRTRPMAKEVNDTETREDERRYYSPIQKEAATFLETSEETGGEYTLIEMEVGPGGGPPPTTT
jgi:RNase adaptor protein for sRNA GlmZ degradation